MKYKSTVYSDFDKIILSPNRPSLDELTIIFNSIRILHWDFPLNDNNLKDLLDIFRRLSNNIGELIISELNLKGSFVYNFNNFSSCIIKRAKLSTCILHFQDIKNLHITVDHNEPFDLNKLSGSTRTLTINGKITQFLSPQPVKIQQV